MQKVKKENVCLIVFAAITALLMVYRVTFSADIYDEIINLNISYRIAMGDVPYYQCWEAFQGGDIFMAPFLWLYIHITGSTAGVVLYSRFIYLLALLALVCVAYNLLKRYLQRKEAFLVSFVIFFWELFCLFYLWYDTVSVLLLLLGDLLIAYALTTENGRRKKAFFLAAGFVHCAMVLSYPAYLPLALGFAVILFVVDCAILKMSAKNAFIDVVFYGLGAFLFILPLLAWLFSRVDVKHFLETLQIILGTRGPNDVTMLFVIKALLKGYLVTNKLFFPGTILLSLFYFGALKNKKSVAIFLLGLYILPLSQPYFFTYEVWSMLPTPLTYLLLVIPVVLLLGIVCYRVPTNDEWCKAFLIGLFVLPVLNYFCVDADRRCYPNYLSYLALWCPFVFCLCKNKSVFGKILLSFFWLPSMITTILIPTTSVWDVTYGPLKAWEALLPGALATIYFVVQVWNERFGTQRGPKGSLVLICICICTLLLNTYSYVYLNFPSLAFNKVLIKDGIYSGIKVTENMAARVDGLQEFVDENTQGCETILAGGYLRYFYMTSGLRPCAPSVEGPVGYTSDGEPIWDITLKYFDYFDVRPDIMFLEPTEVGGEGEKMIHQYYQLVDKTHMGEFDINVYKKKTLIS